VCSSIDFHGTNFKALVYEFLPNGNLDRWLHQHRTEHGEQKALDLCMRLQIAIDVASALEYLHQSKPLPINHCDLKPSNVLLDRELEILLLMLGILGWQGFYIRIQINQVVGHQ